MSSASRRWKPPARPGSSGLRTGASGLRPGSSTTRSDASTTTSGGTVGEWANWTDAAHSFFHELGNSLERPKLLGFRHVRIAREPLVEPAHHWRDDFRRRRFRLRHHDGAVDRHG